MVAILKQLLAVDTSAIITMKNAAKRDINCELQNSVNHRNFERILQLGETPKLRLFEYRTQKHMLVIIIESHNASRSVSLNKDQCSLGSLRYHL